MNNPLLTTDPTALGPILADARADYAGSEMVSGAKLGMDYYEGKHAIENQRIFYLNDQNVLTEDKYASNIKIAHQFHTELVDQKVQYLLANGIKAVANEDGNEELQELLDQYFGPAFQLVAHELVEGASLKGFEDVFARTTNEDRIAFQVADSLQLVPVMDEFGITRRVLRFYSLKEYVSGNKAGPVQVKHCEVWDEESVTFYICPPEDKSDVYKLDTSAPLNPRPHVLAVMDDVTDPTNEEAKKLLGRSYGRLPFYRLLNNKYGKSDLAPIKSLIDDYDIINCFLSNNLQDFTDAIYVVSGYKGDDLSKLRQNIKGKKVMATSQDGSLDIKTVEIPHEARKVKLELDEQNIYRFGMGFNAQEVGNGNITNVVIKSHYTLLAMKANKIEARLRAMLEWMAELVCEDMARLGLGAYTPQDFSFDIEPEVLVNESDLVKDELVTEQIRQTAIANILAVSTKLDDETVMRQICDLYDLDFDDVMSRLDEDSMELPPMPAIPNASDPKSQVPPVDPNTPAPSPDGLDEPTDPNATIAKVSMNGAQISAILQIVESVKSGTLDYESAVALLVSSFPFDESKAREILGSPDAKPAQATPATPAQGVASN